MSTRRERLRKAEKLLRQGRLEPAIAEYVALIEEEPTDWATTNALGDLYVRAKRVDQAVGQYTRIADHFWKEGFFPKAAALYKKILKVKPTDEPSLMRVGDISAQQGKLVDAKAAFTAIIALRRKRGDANAANEVVVRLGALDPQDLGARRSAAQAQVELGRVPEAIEAMGQLAADLSAEGKTADAVGVLKAVVELDPVNVASRARLARIYLATGNLGAAREYLTEEVAGDDPAMLLAVAELKLRGGDGEAGRDVIRRVIGLSPDASEQVMALAASLSDADAGAAFVCVDELAEVAMRSEDWEAASVVLQEFTERVPRHVDALVKLVDVCVDAGLDEALIAAQAELAEAYLDKGQVSEASVIAEDLAVREPSNEAHVDRYRRALVAAGDPDPDAKVAEQCHTEAAEGGVSDGLDDLGADFFDEPAPAVAGLQAGTHDAAGAEPVAPVNLGAVAPAHTPATQAEGVIDLSEGGLDLSGLFAEDFAPATAPPGPAPPAPALAPVAAAARPAPAAPQGGAPTGGTMEIDLTSVLGDLEGPGAAGAPAPPAPAQAPDRPSVPAGMLRAPKLDDVFDQLRDEASSDASVEDAAAQQYQLGLSYRQMGKLDEAIGSLETAARSPRYRFNSAVMLGRLYFDKQEPARALDWLERAAEAPAPSDDDHRALMYHLGVTLERLGETARALGVLMELQADAGEYRDVGERVGRLSRLQTGG